MNPARIQVTGVRVAGEKVPRADVAFNPGLNLIVGASDTGKTYICTLVDYFLGAGTPPEDIPESLPYHLAFLGLKLPGGAEKTVLRGFKDDRVRLYDAPWNPVNVDGPSVELIARHRTGYSASLSYCLN